MDYMGHNENNSKYCLDIGIKSMKKDTEYSFFLWWIVDKGDSTQIH